MKLLTVTVIATLCLFGCVSKQIDRNYVNDPLMQINKGGSVSDISPLTGLKSRDKSSGGSSCSVCAH